MTRFTPSRLDAGIFLISFAVLLFELLLTRVFSVTMYYHLSFLVVSLAMLGLGASGLLANLAPRLFAPDRMSIQAAWSSLLFAATAVASVAYALTQRVRVESLSANWNDIAIIFGFCTVPFVVGGLTVALLLTHNAERANRLYFFDLVGAALACVAFVPATNLLGAPTAILASAAVAASAAAVLAGPARATRAVASLAAITLAAAAGLNTTRHFFDVSVVKGDNQRPVLALGWNSFSRVEVNGIPEDLVRPLRPVVDGLSSRLDPAYRVREVWLRYDADAATPITGFDGDPSKLEHLGYSILSAAYHTRRFDNVLVIGSGGGQEILTALHLGSGPVTGVEINPTTIEFMRGPFREFTGGLYDGYPGVRIVHDDGRTFVRGANEQYGLIQASLVDTWAASASGAHALTENSLYTVEAFQDYLARLQPDGMISFSRWYFDPPSETLRLCAVAAEALRRTGTSEPERHLAVVRTEPQPGRPAIATLLVKRSPFTPEELGALRAWAAEMDFRCEFLPGDAGAGNSFHQLFGPGAESFIAAYPLDIGPVFDDQPFFFDRVPLLPWVANRLGISDSIVGRQTLTLGGQSLLVALLMSLAFTLMLLVLPALLGRRGGGNAARGALWVVYFACLGLGFIVVEIVLIQRFSLFLGYPVYSLAVVLFTLLLASASGSLAAGRIRGSGSLVRVLFALCGALIVYAAVVPLVTLALAGAPAWARIAAAAATMAPVGFLMGMPFPTGLRLAGVEGERLVPWAWAVNGASSVLGSVLAVVFSMTFGFSTSFFIGVAAYAVALGVAWALARGHATEVVAAPEPARYAAD